MHAKGRNGVFEVVDISLFKASHSGTIFIEVFSRRRGKNAPIFFEGTKKEMTEFAMKILKECGDEFRAEIAIASVKDSGL